MMKTNFQNMSYIWKKSLGYIFSGVSVLFVQFLNIAQASEPFGNIINLTSGSSDDGDYFACVISCTQLLEPLCEVRSEIGNSA